jgi:CelD/BcsL family acetyltransferase involved in cellulose biosynthesis
MVDSPQAAQSSSIWSSVISPKRRSAAMSEPQVTNAQEAGSAFPGSRWSVEHRRDDDALTALADEWRDLYARCPTATPFQSHAWLDSWWREYGKPGRLRVVLVRWDGRLVAAAALMLTIPWFCPVLTPVGRGISDFTDVLVDGSCAGEATKRLVDALFAEAGWQVLDLPEVRPGGPAARLTDAWPSRQWRFSAATCLELTVQPFEELLDGLPGSNRRTLRKKLRKIDTVGVEYHVVPPAEVASAIDDLVRLHAMQWNGRGGNPEHFQPRFARHLVAALEPMVQADQAIIRRYSWEGQVVCCDILLLGHHLAGGYLYGIHPELRQHVDVYILLLRDRLGHVHNRGFSTLNLLRGTEPHKERLRPRRVTSSRVLLGRQGGVRVRCYAAAVRSRRQTADLLREHLPQVRALLVRVRHAQHSLLAPKRRIPR